ncbi:MAG: hypothetical protein COA38_16125 [Fluviicola sp.]|nr:MAG: hypothetical protein COA38_16125 [Fluviicola sp.]
MNMKLIVSLTLFIIISCSSFAQSPCKEIVGYYPNWQWYDRAQLVNPQTIDYSKYTILNYCFFAPQTDGSINSTDAWADENLLLGQFDWANNVYLPNTSIVDLAHNNNVQVLPSIGGWTLSANFPGIAADPVKRVNFANACVALISQYDFDGVDIDWEYPGYPPHGGTPADYNNYTLFLQEVRTAIDAYGLTVGKPMLLTVAVGAAEDRMDDVNWTAVEPLLDIINLMSYDFFGAWDSSTNHNAPLYAPTVGDITFNLDYAVDKLTNFYNVNPNKITAGIGFYGRSAKTTGSAGLHVPTTGSTDATTFFEDAGSPLYYNIMSNIGLFTDNWDAAAQVPYLTGNGTLNTFVSYDNEQSIGLKAQYIVDNNLRGAIIWEITGDYMETSPGSGIIAGTPLADTLNNVFCNYTGGSGTAPIVTLQANTTTICSGNSVTITANGANSYVWNTTASTQSITVSPTTTTTYTVTGTNAFGNDVQSITINVNSTPNAPSITVVDNCGSSTLSTSGTNLLWSTSETSPSISVNTAGTYTVTQTVNGCTSVIASGVANPLEIPVISLVTATNPSSCGNSDGSIQVGGSGTGTVSWTGSSNGSTPNVNLPFTITGLSAGGYTVEFDNGCSSNLITSSLSDPGAPQPPTISVNGQTTLCQGESTILSSSLTGNLTWSTSQTSPTISVDAAGTYTVTYTDGNGCSATSLPTTIVVNPLPIVSLSADSITCESYGTSALIGMPTGGAYSGTGVTGDLFDPSISGVGTFTLSYEYTDANGCTNSESTSIIVDDCANVNEIIPTEVSVYPNPTFDQLTIEMSGDFSVRISDVKGSIVAIYQATDIISVNTSTFERGVYFVSLLGSTYTYQTKVIKQ